MKKILMFLVSIMITVATINEVSAANDVYYTPPKGSGNYEKGQHTYGFYKKEGGIQYNYGPILYSIFKDEVPVDLTYENFKSKYTLPWTMDVKEYDVVLCADLYADFKSATQFKKVPMSKSTFIDNNIKENLIGMLKNTYPYISKEEMLKRLVENGVLVEKEVDGQKYITAAANKNPEASVTRDEILLALQMAIYHYTDPGKIYMNYRITINRGKGTTALNANDLSDYTYPNKTEYSDVEHNVDAIYNWLITLKDTDEVFNIKEVTIDNNKSYTMHVKANKKANDEDNLSFVVSQNGKIIGEYDLKNLNVTNDGEYTFNLNKLDNLTDEVVVTVTGQEYSYDGVYAYEAVIGSDSAQTLIGVSRGYRTVYNEAVVAGAFKENPNIKVPNTLDNIFKYILILVSGGVVLLLASILKFKNKKS